MHAHHGHEHPEGTPHHDHEEVMEVYEGEPIKVRFVREDGIMFTVHFRDGELRVCGSVMRDARYPSMQKDPMPIEARQHKADVIAVCEVEFAGGW